MDKSHWSREEFGRFLSVQEFDDPLAEGIAELGKAREVFVDQIALIMRGRGGSTQRAADTLLRAHIDHYAERFQAVASAIGAEDDLIEERKITALMNICKIDQAERIAQMRRRCRNHPDLAALPDEYLAHIVMPFADPDGKTLADDDPFVLSQETAVALYRDLICRDVGVVHPYRHANIAESARAEKRDKAIGATAAAGLAGLMLYGLLKGFRRKH